MVKRKDCDLYYQFDAPFCAKSKTDELALRDVSSNCVLKVKTW